MKYGKQEEEKEIEEVVEAEEDKALRFAKEIEKEAKGEGEGRKDGRGQGGGIEESECSTDERGERASAGHHESS